MRTKEVSIRGKGLYPKDIIVPVFVYPFNVGILATIPSAGVSWYFPPNGITTVFAPIVLSNLSTNPFWEQQFKLDIVLKTL